MSLSVLFKPNLRKKLLFFSIVLAIIPLGISGNNMITITRDELKSSANEEISATAAELAGEVDSWYLDIWKAPMLLIKNAIDNENLGAREKVSLLTTGLKNISDIVTLQVTVRGFETPILAIQDGFSQKLQEAEYDPISVLKLSQAEIDSLLEGREDFVGDLKLIDKTDDWLLSIIIPLDNKIQGKTAVLSARINLARFRVRVENHPFTKTGILNFIEGDGKKIFDSGREDLSGWKVVAEAKSFLGSGSRAIGVKPFARPDGRKMLGAYAFPNNLPWGIIVEKDEANAYLAVSKMVQSLLIYVILGLSVAIVGAVFFSQRISKPIVHIGKIAQVVGGGDFTVRVSKRKARDEITDLGKRMNEMIEGLRERFQLTKFVSGETMLAIKRSDDEGVKLGGERKLATVFFSDIRGFTSFSEKVEPEVVIEMLNTYLHAQAQIVKKYSGDIDKYVGDELVAVFQGDDMVLNASKCAVEIQKTMTELNADHPEWNIGIGIGINTGDMVMGAMGSEDRMDYTILGDTVNLGARLCDHALRMQNLLTGSSYDMIKDNENIFVEALEPIKVKGKTDPIPIFNVTGFKE